MPIYDYECKHCGHVELDVYARHADQHLDCVSCPEKMERYISLSGVHTANEDADWIRSVTEVVEKGGSCRVSTEFLKNPTRTNLKRWMKEKGLRHVENHHGGPPMAIDRRSLEAEQRSSEKQVHKAVWDKHRERNTLNVR